MKIKLFLATIALLAITSISCSKDEEPATNTPTTVTPVGTGLFTATIAGENFTTNEIVLAQVSAGGTQAFYTIAKNGISFSSAIFPENFPIGQAKPIAYSGYITYKLGDITYIPKSGTMTLSIMENYKRMKGTFTGVFVSGATEISISGEFDAKN